MCTIVLIYYANTKSLPVHFLSRLLLVLFEFLFLLEKKILEKNEEGWREGGRGSRTEREG